MQSAPSQLPSPTPELSDLAPILFQDELVIRARNNAHVRMGSPYTFLNNIGIEAIIEGFIHGRNIVDVAKELNISVIVLLNWINSEGHAARVDEAIVLSSEGYLSEVGQSIKKAQSQFDLQKAKELAKHNTFIASKVNRKKYGQDVKQASNTGGVTFVMHIGQQVQVHGAAQQSIDSPPEIIDSQDFFAIIPQHKAPDALDPDSIGPFEPEPFLPAPQTLPKHLQPINMSIGGAAPNTGVTTNLKEVRNGSPKA